MKIYQASVYGSLMILGEHAVLRSQPCIVCAIDKKIIVSLQKTTKDDIYIKSSLGEIKASRPHKDFKFVLAAINYFKKNVPVFDNFDLTIESEFSHQIGFGSSAAVTIATLKVISQYLNISYNKKDLLKIAIKLVREVQIIGSGADLAASIYGGIISYKIDQDNLNNIEIEELPNISSEINVIYSGYKTSTKIVVEKVNKSESEFPQIYKAIFQSITKCVLLGKQAIRESNMNLLGTIFNIHQGLQESLGVSDKVMSNIIWQLRQSPDIYGAKISGSGLGDCIIVLGKCNDSRKIPIQIANY